MAALCQPTKGLLLMKISVLTLAFATIVSTACNQSLSPDGIVQKAVNAHGGKEKWEKIIELEYEKTTVVFDSLGKKISKAHQRHVNRFKPSFSSEMHWTENDTLKSAFYQDSKTKLFAGGVWLPNEILEKKYKKDMDAALFVFFQPYKILTDSKTMHYEGEEALTDGAKAHVIRVSFSSDQKNGDTWWFYFDTKTFRLKANKVKHGSTYSFIENLQQETATGLFLNEERKSYRIDSAGNKKYLIAHYFYKVLKVSY